MRVHVVIAPGVDVLAVYAEHRQVLAQGHARTVTGAVAVTLDVLDAYPTAVMRDIMSDYEFDDDQETPVEVPVPPGLRKP